MSLIYRPDYAKFTLNLPRGLFRQYYDIVREVASKRKFYGDWDKHHHVQAMNSFHPDREETILEIWGEWTAIVHDLSFDFWAAHLRRYDVRAVVWDATEEAVLEVGQRVQRTLTAYNSYVFNTKPASKRRGRDRGGKGFRIGSGKSDLCLVVYKRGREPVAQEFRFQGKILRNMIELVEAAYVRDDRVFDRWAQLDERASFGGSSRLTRCLEAVGIGTWWPTATPSLKSDYDAAQASFAAIVEDIGPHPYEPDYEHYQADDETHLRIVRQVRSLGTE